MTSTNPAAPVILIIEDEPSFREALEMAIGDEGYLVLAAANGSEALTILEVAKPDVILMDLHMPVMNGIEFLRTYQIRFEERVPVIVCSTKFPRTELEQAGVAAFLSKPVEIDDLLVTIQKCTALHHQNGQVG